MSDNESPQRDNDGLPKWYVKILERLVKTILKPILKLRPAGEVNWENFGRIIGIVERFKTFLSHDVEREWVEAGLDKMTDQQWEKLEPQLGLDKAREQMAQSLGRPLGKDEPLENAANELTDRLEKYLESLKSVAYRHLALQHPKTTILFHKGVAEGYKCFLDVDGSFAGDRGRTRLYFELLAHRNEIEKFRQENPGASRRDLQQWILRETTIPILDDDEWFDHLCDEICLGVKGVGRKSKTVPV
ncbi:MAG TPA: hypothetical protein VGO67_09130 [Verrucomicrobiae bacterium]